LISQLNKKHSSSSLQLVSPLAHTNQSAQEEILREQFLLLKRIDQVRTALVAETKDKAAIIRQKVPRAVFKK